MNPVFKALNLKVYTDRDSNSFIDMESDRRLEICRNIGEIKIGFDGNEDFRPYSSGWKKSSDIGYNFPIQLYRRQRSVFINAKDANSYKLLHGANVQIEIDQGSPIPVPFDKFTKFFKVSAPIVTGDKMKIEVAAKGYETYIKEVPYEKQPHSGAS